MRYSNLRRVSTHISRLNTFIGTGVSWLVLAMVLVIVYDVSMRYLFQIGSVALQELEWHMFAVLFLFGAAYSLKENSHVCVDIVYQSAKVSDNMRAWVNILGTVFFLLPFSFLVINSAWPFVENAYVINEGSPDPGGLPHRYLLKLAIPIGFVLLVLQGIAFIIDNALKLKTGSGGHDVQHEGER